MLAAGTHGRASDVDGGSGGVPIAVLLGAAFLKERLPSGTFVGGACVLAVVVTGPVVDSRDRVSD